MNTKTLLLVGGGVVAAFALFEFMKGGTSTTTTILPGAGASVPSVPQLNPQELSYVDTSFAGIPKWDPTWLSQIKPQLVASDLDNLYSIMANYWATGQQAPDSLDQWWWKFANKYGLT